MKTERLTLVLSSAEMQALRKSSKVDLRHPREQARYILQSVLLGNKFQEKTEPASQLVSQDGQASGFPISQPM